MKNHNSDEEMSCPTKFDQLQLALFTEDNLMFQMSDYSYLTKNSRK